MTTPPDNSEGFADRAIRDFANRHRTPEHATRAVLEAHRLLGLTVGVELAERRYSREPLQSAVADAKASETLLRAYQQIATILAEHLDRSLEHHRSQYSPELRYRILRVKNLLLWSQEETARQFRVSPGTVSRWEREADRTPEKKTIGALVRPNPPVRRYADIVRELVQSMATSGFGGNKRIAQTLARAGWKVARDTVRRIRKEKTRPKPEPTGQKPRSVKARHPGHVFMADLTEIPALFRILCFKLAVVFDVFSRIPLTGKLFLGEPPSDEIASLVKTAVKKHTSPRYFISDRGIQFTAGVFRKTLSQLGIRPRFGAVGKTGSIALIERFWRAAKDLLALSLWKPILQQDLEKRLELVLHYYAYLRPHQGLGGATPAEIFHGKPPSHVAALPPPRGRPGEARSAPLFEIVYLDSERRLPYLVQKAA